MQQRNKFLGGKKWAKIILQKIHGFSGFLNSFEEF